MGTYLTILGYVAISSAGFYAAFFAEMTVFAQENRKCVDAGHRMQAVTTWCAITNVIALVAGIVFYYGEKGGTISVLGSITFLFNFFNMLVLFISAQVFIFSDKVSECDALISPDVNSSYRASKNLLVSYIVVQYGKIFVL